MSEFILRLEGLSHSYKDQEVLKDIDLDLKSRERISVLGESGSGKSTLLRCIAGFEKIKQGKIVLGGKTVSDRNSTVPTELRNIGMVVQERALFPHLTVKKNIMFGVENVPNKEDTVDELAHLFKITNLLDKFPAEISGGEQQRVAFARSLAPEPSLLMLDEPFNALDEELREELYSELTKIFDEKNLTVLLVTHDTDEARTLTSRLTRLENGVLGDI